MVCDAHFLRLNVSYLYNQNMNLVDLSDQLHHLYQVDHWMCMYKCWWSLFFWGHGLILFNLCIDLQNTF